MALLIDRLPTPAVERELQLRPGLSVKVKPLQPIVWISLAPPSVLDLPANAPRFPAVIDTGFNQTLLIQDAHLQEWGGVNVGDLETYPGETARYGNQIWHFRMADIWLHSLPENEEPANEPYCLETHPGILVVADTQRRQRLPILGMRALAWNRINLRLEFDGPNMGWMTLATT